MYVDDTEMDAKYWYLINMLNRSRNATKCISKVADSRTTDEQAMADHSGNRPRYGGNREL